MKRDSYKKGPRFGPGACGYLEDTIQQPAVAPVEPIVVVEPAKVEPVVVIEQVEVEQEVIVEPIFEAQPLVKPAVAPVDSKSFDKKKK